MLEKGGKYIISITGISSDGNGVGNACGMAIFVPLTAVGDMAEVVIDKVFPRYAKGRLERIVTPSPDRTEAVCSIYESCGGCHFRHINYPAQLKAKRNIIDSAFRRIGGFRDFSCDDIIGMETPERYRNKCIFQIGTDGNGELIYGFYANRTHNIIPIPDCMTGIPENRAICDALIGYMKENNIPAYDEKTDSGTVKRIFIRKAAATGEIMAAVSVNDDRLTHTDRLIKALTTAVPKLVSIYININKDKHNSALGRKNRLIHGIPEITDTLCGIRFTISPQSFYQVNPVMTEKLYGKALEYADISQADNVLDVYCGIGTISLAASKKAAHVTGIEIVEQAVRDAEKNAAANGITNADFFADSAERAVPKLISGGMKPDIVILDPPRKGSDEKTLAAILSAAPKRIVYVSCNPATLARDAKYLAAHGYTPEKCTGIDMFPHTCHVETVCQLVLRRSSVHKVGRS